MEQTYRIDGNPDVQPLAVTKETAMRITAMPRLVQRWLFHNWVEIVRPGGRGRQTIIDFASLRRAYDRYRAGEHPPLLPSEVSAKETTASGRQRSPGDSLRTGANS